MAAGWVFRKRAASWRSADFRPSAPARAGLSAATRRRNSATACSRWRGLPPAWAQGRGRSRSIISSAGAAAAWIGRLRRGARGRCARALLPSARRARPPGAGFHPPGGRVEEPVAAFARGHEQRIRAAATDSVPKTELKQHPLTYGVRPIGSIASAHSGSAMSRSSAGRARCRAGARVFQPWAGRAREPAGARWMRASDADDTAEQVLETGSLGFGVVRPKKACSRPSGPVEGVVPGGGWWLDGAAPAPAGSGREQRVKQTGRTPAGTSSTADGGTFSLARRRPLYSTCLQELG